MNNINSADTKISKFTPFAERLLHWYSRTAREMPWRIPPRDHAMGVRAEPYHVWLSEIMLQQTQVATVKDYFLKFIGLWPTVYDLSQAEEDEILTAWAGLGYYSRARNLKKCADLIVSDHGGKFPDTFDALKTLPGIGDYTAAAIATIAFDQPIPVIDGNIERVITRHAYIETPLPKGKVEIRAHLETVLSQEKPGEFAQAMMDLGATLCTPKRPNCLLCPVQEDCIARQKGDMELFPVKPVKKQKPTRKGAAFIVEDGSGAIFLQRHRACLITTHAPVDRTSRSPNHECSALLIAQAAQA